MINKLILGSYVSLKNPDYLKGAVLEAAKYKNKAMMFFLGSPQRFSLLSKEKLNLNEFDTLLMKNQILKENVCVHLPYLINLANTVNSRVVRNSLLLLKNQFELCDFLKIEKVILHPGAFLNADLKTSLFQVVKYLDEILEKFPKIKLSLETMSGKGTQIGKNFDELAFIINHSQYKKQIGVCFDLCHLYSAGFDIKNKFDEILNDFNKKIGLEKLWVLHINDTKNDFNSKKDNHENINHGKLGLETIWKIVNHPKLKNKTMILETPYHNGNPWYKKEIEILNKKYDWTNIKN